MLMSLRETEHCVCKPEGFPNMSIKIKSGRGGGGGRRGMDRRQSLARGGGYDNQGSRGGGGDQWSRGSDTTRKQNTVHLSAPKRFHYCQFNYRIFISTYYFKVGYTIISNSLKFEWTLVVIPKLFLVMQISWSKWNKTYCSLHLALEV
mmetsp:Transcript_22974/g.42147  ORF Transcript_22974/g.42147 Transcript_22974/m.42147 type:complete len:148 (-) Transcript_22974:957-1400(-)